MMQFGNAIYRDDLQSSEVMSFIAKFQAEIHPAEPAIHQLRKLVRTAPKPGRSLLVYARLLFWGYVSYDDALEDILGALSIENFNQLGAFERIEIATCFGPRLLSTLMSVEISYVRKYREFSDNLSINYQFDSDEVWCYTPPPTGLFSVVENILLAKYLCLLQRKSFKLDDDFHRWWRYPVHFNELFGSLFTDENIPTNRPIKYIQWNIVRDIMSTVNIDVLQAFANFKKEEYKKIRTRLANWLGNVGEDVKSYTESAVYFIRGGDKLVLETMPLPTHVIEKDFELLFKLSDCFMVLSDDYQLAQDFTKTFGSAKVENITEKTCNGYFVQNMSTIDDVRVIIKNYMIISSVKYSMSCPSSNLVNSAHWSNENLSSIYLSSTPLLKYAYL